MSSSGVPDHFVDLRRMHVISIDIHIPPKVVLHYAHVTARPATFDAAQTVPEQSLQSRKPDFIHTITLDREHWPGGRIARKFGTSVYQRSHCSLQSNAGDSAYLICSACACEIQAIGRRICDRPLMHKRRACMAVTGLVLGYMPNHNQSYAGQSETFLRSRASYSNKRDFNVSLR
ncbi:hypothetical protein J7T55_005572 [Diaporthe amygdali]|uniref:uncharacterized protein n=1 Tax=Phomopsis amygdali TaxID=1214568 RepID=UPI0022FE3DA2|nr:uncharacterized protein J7T55_005572 [Diaporthe amygdali]KAJ0124234.1 hypothetical protein J7T55_005572 [Diaporthe amygdali]